MTRKSNDFTLFTQDSIPTQLNLQKYFLLEVSFSCDPGAREAGAFPDVWESVYPCIDDIGNEVLKRHTVFL